jgi:hypothetical protein
VPARGSREAALASAVENCKVEVVLILVVLFLLIVFVLVGGGVRL